MAEDGKKLIAYPDLDSSMDMMLMNEKFGPFSDIRVRQALNMAIDRWNGASNLSKIVSVKGVGATQRPGSPWAATDAELEKLPGFARDMEAARAEMAQQQGSRQSVSSENVYG